MEETYKLGLHESLHLKIGGENVFVLRVIGGWVYKFETTSCFVPDIRNQE